MTINPKKADYQRTLCDCRHEAEAMREWTIRQLDRREMNALTRHGVAVFRVNYGTLIVADISAHYQDERMAELGEGHWPFVVDTRLSIGTEICGHISKVWTILSLKARAVPPIEFKIMVQDMIEDAVLIATEGVVGAMRAIARRTEERRAPV